MSGNLNFDDGTILCTAGKKSIYVTEKLVEDGFDTYKPKGDLKFEHAIDKDTERQILYISASSGAGKSHYALGFAQAYHKAYPKRPIYLFSYLDQCDTLDKLKAIKRVKIKADNFLTDEIEAIDLKESLCIFDDCDCISDKKTKKKVFEILKKILETGRHFKTSVIFTSHTACNGAETKTILNEASSLTIFPKTMGNKNLKYLLESYFGLDKHEICKIKALPSRWVTLTKTYPPVVFTQNEVYVR
jgi:hypothetical protein